MLFNSLTQCAKCRCTSEMAERMAYTEILALRGRALLMVLGGHLRASWVILGTENFLKKRNKYLIESEVRPSFTVRTKNRAVLLPISLKSSLSCDRNKNIYYWLLQAQFIFGVHKMKLQKRNSTLKTMWANISFRWAMLYVYAKSIADILHHVSTKKAARSSL